VCCSVLQCVAVCCSVLQCVAAATWGSWRLNTSSAEELALELFISCVVVYCSVLQCVAACCSSTEGFVEDQQKFVRLKSYIYTYIYIQCCSVL